MTSSFVNIAGGAESQSMYPFRPGYVPPDRGQAGLSVTPLKRGVWTTNSGDPATDADGAIRDAEFAFRQHLSSIDPTDFTTGGLAKYIAQFGNSQEMAAVDRAVQAVSDAADDADAAADSARSDLTSDGDAAAETRALRYWSGTARRLDAVTDSGSLAAKAQTLVADATPDQLGTLIEELPGYLESRGVSSEWLDGAVAQVVPDLANALAAQATVRNAQTVIAANANKLRNAVNNTDNANGYGSGQLNALRDGLRFLPLSAVK